jgi:hypothetical protein
MRLQGFEIDQRRSWEILARIGDNSSNLREQNGGLEKKSFRPFATAILLVVRKSSMSHYSGTSLTAE